ncbi:MAG: dihydropyrimidine dehydrogenase subunit A [Saprospiraceae bacterium]|nr:MAG: dihydropyrimidine dehydrogenase subunit A [Saprospiraceae bacterium]
MADPKGFLKYDRELPKSRSPKSRVKDYKEIYKPFPLEKTVEQAARCMDCGIPFCHNSCPLGNIIPEFNDAVYQENWAGAFHILSSTNNFPEFTGRICPAPCEAGCVLAINQPAVAIEHIEKSIAEIAFEKGYVRPQPPAVRTGKKVAIIGSGPAGLAAAAQLNKAGHTTTVFERKDRIGGLLRYGIPDFKLEKWVLERRIALMEAEGIRFRTNAEVGGNVDPNQVLSDFDAVLLCGGSTIPRDIGIPGRHLEGIHFAMDFLEQNNQRIAGDQISETLSIHAKGKKVVVIGGGDTGSDCVGTSNRHGAKSVYQLEIMPMPPKDRDENSWPNWPWIMRTSSSHEEGCDREWALFTKAFVGDKNGCLKALQVVRVEWEREETGRFTKFKEIEGSEQEIPCDLAFIAAGFLHPQHKGLLEDLGVSLDERGNVAAGTQNYQTSIDKVFSAGDMRRGQSLVVWAISEGREAAHAVDQFLMGSSRLEKKDDAFMSVSAQLQDI